MCGRSVNAGLLPLLALLLAVAPLRASAKTLTFATGMPIGVGIVGGLEGKPGSDFAAGTQTSASNNASYFAFEPFFDLVNAQIRAHAGWHFYPLLSGSGTDSHGKFTESSDAGSLDLGARLLLAPYMAADLRSRFYFVIGANDSTVKLKNQRKYSSGSMAGQTNVEQLKGAGTEWNGGLGYEFFLLQNYSLSLEGGYRSVTVESFHYGTSTDVSGATVTSGATATNGSGGNKAFHSYVPYGQISLNLNL